MGKGKDDDPKPGAAASSMDDRRALPKVTMSGLDRSALLAFAHALGIGAARRDHAAEMKSGGQGSADGAAQLDQAEDLNMRIPTAREIAALRDMSTSQWENAGSISPGKFGELTRRTVVAEGWAETRDFHGRLQFRLTEVGAKALRIANLPTAGEASANKMKLKLIQPRLKPARSKLDG